MPACKHAMQRVRQRRAGRIQNRGVKQAGGAGRRRMAAFALPGVQPDVVVIAARGNERGLVAVTLHDLEAEHAAIKPQRAIEVGDLEMNMPDPGACDDGFDVAIASSFRAPDAAQRVALRSGALQSRGRTSAGVRYGPGSAKQRKSAASRPGHDAYANSDTCPSGSSNSNVFSVIDTMV